MKLTDKEMEVMVVLWDNGSPMTAAEVIEVSDKRTWRDNSIYTILNTLIKMVYIELSLHEIIRYTPF